MATALPTQSGSATLQGQLWGERAHDFATQEPKAMALYEEVLHKLRIAGGTFLLDVGCGPGLFLKLAEQRGATVSGLDAAAPFIEIARQRVPAAELVVGEMERLPFADRSFDVVTGLNSFQFTANPGRALAEAARVATTDARIVIATWGPPERCEAAAYFEEVGALLPPPPPGAPGPFALSKPGAIEQLMALGGMSTGPAREVLCVWEYPDDHTLLRAFKSSGVAVKAIDTVGEKAVSRAILKATEPFRLSDGSYRLENVFCYAIARAADGRIRPPR